MDIINGNVSVVPKEKEVKCNHSYFQCVCAAVFCTGECAFWQEFSLSEIDYKNLPEKLCEFCVII